MQITSSRAFQLTAILGFIAVALGAFGAHGLKDAFALRPGAQGWWEKATLYQFVHVGIMLIVARSEPFAALPWLLFCGGIILFSGSLYLLALTGALWLGAITPLGGLCFLAGWLGLAFSSRPAAGRL